jgi:phosphatidylserine decarboxylase
MVTTRLAAETLRLLPRKRLSRALGRAAASEPPRALLSAAIDLYVRAYDVDLAECVIPEGGFRSFNEFFSRPLVAGARPLDPDPDALLCPADGKVEDLGPIETGSRFSVKGKEYEVGELLGGGDPSAFVGGQFAVVYLSPRDYHRVHAPVDGVVEEIRHVGGTLYPVNRIGLEHVPRLFAKNERVAIHQKSERFGEVVTVMVAAIVVGGIELPFEPRLATNKGHVLGEVRYGGRGPNIARGEELGRFVLGSTAIVLTTPEAKLTARMPSGAKAKMGEALFSLRDSSSRGGRA